MVLTDVTHSEKLPVVNIRCERRKRLPLHRGKSNCGLTSGTPIFLQASRKFSTFLRHLAMPSLGWKQSRTETIWKKNLQEDLSPEQTERGLPQQVRERGCQKPSEGERDWRGGRARLHPSGTVPGPRGGWASAGSRCSEGKKIESRLKPCWYSTAAAKHYKLIKGKSKFHCCVWVILNGSEKEAWR